MKSIVCIYTWEAVCSQSRISTLYYVNWHCPVLRQMWLAPNLWQRDYTPLKVYELCKHSLIGLWEVQDAKQQHTSYEVLGTSGFEN